MKENTEYCYLMTDGDLFKIGKSINPIKRHKQLQVGNPKIKLIDYSFKVSEIDLHQLYQAHRVQGEWFKLTENQIRDILKLYKNGKSWNFSARVAQVKTINRKNNNHSNFIMPFGKYQGIKISEINDIEYLRWMKSIKHKELSNKERKRSVLYSSLHIQIKKLGGY